MKFYKDAIHTMQGSDGLWYDPTQFESYFVPSDFVFFGGGFSPWSPEDSDWFYGASYYTEEEEE